MLVIANDSLLYTCKTITQSPLWDLRIIFHALAVEIISQLLLLEQLKKNSFLLFRRNQLKMEKKVVHSLPSNTQLSSFWIFLITHTSRGELKNETQALLSTTEFHTVYANLQSLIAQIVDSTVLPHHSQNWDWDIPRLTHSLLVRSLLWTSNQMKTLTLCGVIIFHNSLSLTLCLVPLEANIFLRFCKGKLPLRHPPPCNMISTCILWSRYNMIYHFPWVNRI